MTDPRTGPRRRYGCTARQAYSLLLAGFAIGLLFGITCWPRWRQVPPAPRPLPGPPDEPILKTQPQSGGGPRIRVEFPDPRRAKLWGPLD